MEIVDDSRCGEDISRMVRTSFFDLLLPIPSNASCVSEKKAVSLAEKQNSKKREMIETASSIYATAGSGMK